jgi:PAS domain S-box-containing protein
MKRSPGRRGLAVGFCLLVMILVINAALSYRSVRELNRDAHEVAKSIEVLQALGDIESSLARSIANYRGYLLSGNAFYKDRYLANRSVLLTAIQSLEQRDSAQGSGRDQIGSPQLGELRQIVDSFLLSMDGELDKAPVIQNSEIAEQLTGPAAVERRTKWIELVADLRGAQEGILSARRAANDQTYATALVSLTIAGVLGLILLGLYVWLVQRYIVNRSVAAQAIQEQGALLQATLTGIGEGVIATDADGKIRFINPTAEALTAWKSADAIGQPLDFVCHLVSQRTGERIPNPAFLALREGKSFGLSTPALLIDRKGKARPVEDSGAPIRDAENDVVGAVLVIRDVTEQRRQENNLIEREQQVRMLLDSTAEGIYGIDRDGVCTFCNAACLKLLGYSHLDDLVGHATHPLLHHSRADGTAYPESDCRILAAMRNGQEIHVDDEVMWRADGTSLPAEYRCHPVRREGVTVGAVVTFLDIRARRETEEAQKERQNLVALRAAKSAALAKDASLADALTDLAEALVQHLGVTLARIWTREGKSPMLALRASVGKAPEDNEPYRRVRIGEHRIGRVAERGEPLIDNELSDPKRSHNHAWADRAGFATFAGYPLMIEGRVVGVMAVYSKTRLTASVLSDLGQITDGVAQYIERREAQKLVQEGEERLRLTVEAAELGTWDFSPLTGRMQWSDRCKEIFGLPLDTPITLERFFQLLHPDDRKRVEKDVENAMNPAREGSYSSDYRAVWQDGSIHWIAAKGQTYFEVIEGRRIAVRFLGTAIDMTESREAAAALRASEGRFRQLADAMPQIVWVARQDGQHEYFNQRWYEFTGATPEESVGAGWARALHRDDRSQSLERWRTSLQTGDPFETEFRLRSHAGEERWFLARALAVRNEAGEVIKWFGTATDIEESKRTEEALRRSEEFARSVAEASPDCVKVLDLDGRLLWMSQNGQKSMEVCEFGAIHLKQWESFWEESGLVDVARQAIVEAKAGRMTRFNGPCKTVAGSPRWWDVALTPIHGPGGQVEQILCVSRDSTADREAQERLRISESTLRRVIDSTLTFVGVISPEGRLLEVNRASIEVAGLSREEVIGKLFWECPWWSADSTVAARVHAAFLRSARGELVRYDEVARIAGDAHMTIDFQLQPVYENGQLQFVVPSAVDITDRKRAEEQLAGSQHFLRSSIDALSSHVAVLDDRGMILTVNEAWKRFGDENPSLEPYYTVGANYLAPREGDGRAAGEMTPLVAEQIREVIAGRLPRYATQFASDLAGRNQWFGMTVTRFLDGGPVRVVVAHEDITQRVQSELGTRTRSEQLRRLAEVATRLTAINDVPSILKIVTEGARSILVAHLAVASQTLKQDWAAALTSVSLSDKYAAWTDRCDFPMDSELVERVCLQNRPIRLTEAEVESHPHAELLQRNEGRHPPLRGWLAAPLVRLDGANIGIVHLSDKVGGDFTEDDEQVLVQLAHMASVAIENARLYEQLQESIRRKDEFLAMLGHELRNPLAGIVSGVDALSMFGLTGDAGDMQAVIGRQAAHMSRLVDDLLDVSRIVRGKLTLKPEAVNLSDLVRYVVDDYAKSQLTSDARLESSVPDLEVWVLGDRTRLVQTLTNLVHNACKFGEGDNLVRVVMTVDESDRKVRISVFDQGIGMTPETLSRIFEPFNQADVSVQRSRGGLGLGLALVKGLVNLHSGEVFARSAGLGQGAEFTIVLPTIAPPHQVAAAITSRETAACRILLIDDRRDAILPVQKMLTKDGHLVATALDGPGGVEAAREFKPEIVLCDIGLPGAMDGYGVIRAIRQDPDLSALYVVALTGYSQDDDRQRAREAGFNSHYKKPVTLDQLREIVRERPSFQ